MDKEGTSMMCAQLKKDRFVSEKKKKKQESVRNKRL